MLLTRGNRAPKGDTLETFFGPIKSAVCVAATYYLNCWKCGAELTPPDNERSWCACSTNPMLVRCTCGATSRVPKRVRVSPR